MKSIEFPKDELSHNCSVEWWYFNGHLEDKSSNKYAFMNCLFRIDTDSTKIPLLGRTPLKQVFSAHHIISDLKRKKFYPYLDYVVLASKDSFSKPMLLINYASPIIIKGYFNSVMEETNLFEYRIKTENIDLVMNAVKKPLLVGGTGFISLKPKKTYYYSITNLKTKGKIRVNGKWIEVHGKSWIDHQWNFAPKLSGFDDKWLWFSIQLDNNTEMVCFEYDDGKTKTPMASISNPDNTQEHVTDVKFTSLGVNWKSPATNEKYDLKWRIEIPSKNINLVVEPVIKDQEMRFGTVNYWEGPLTVKGVFKNKNVSGKGFLEFAGRPFQIGNVDFLASSAVDVLKTVYTDSKSLIGPFLKGFR